MRAALHRCRNERGNMTKDTAIELVRQYAEIAYLSGMRDPTIVEIHTRWPEDGSERKAMRWLGFMQGVLYSNHLCTLDELKEHSRRGSALIGNPPPQPNDS